MQSDCTTEYRNGKYDRKVSNIKMAGDEKQERRRKTNEDAHGLYQKKGRKEMKCKCFFFHDSVGHSSLKRPINSYELNNS
jgi:hypothetical protein